MKSLSEQMSIFLGQRQEGGELCRCRTHSGAPGGAGARRPPINCTRTWPPAAPAWRRPRRAAKDAVAERVDRPAGRKSRQRVDDIKADIDVRKYEADASRAERKAEVLSLQRGGVH